MAASGHDRSPEGLASSVPLRRFATVDEVAGLVVARRTDETSHMTGVTLDVNGALDDIAGVVALLCADQGGYVSGATIDVNGGLYFGP